MDPESDTAKDNVDSKPIAIAQYPKYVVTILLLIFLLIGFIAGRYFLPKDASLFQSDQENNVSIETFNNTISPEKASSTIAEEIDSVSSKDATSTSEVKFFERIIANAIDLNVNFEYHIDRNDLMRWGQWGQNSYDEATLVIPPKGLQRATKLLFILGKPLDFPSFDPRIYGFLVYDKNTHTIEIPFQPFPAEPIEIENQTFDPYYVDFSGLFYQNSILFTLNIKGGILEGPIPYSVLKYNLATHAFEQIEIKSMPRIPTSCIQSSECDFREYFFDNNGERDDEGEQYFLNIENDELFLYISGQRVMPGWGNRETLHFKLKYDGQNSFI
jgi:hypothetical protein